MLTERSTPDIGPLSRDALELEARALQPETLDTRVVLLRPGVVLAPDGGAFQLIISALESEQVRGPLNLTSPNPVRNRELAEAFAQATSHALRPPISGRALHLMFGKAAIIITHGQRVLPARALELGHEFRHPTLTGALDDLTRRARDPSERSRSQRLILNTDAGPRGEDPGT